MATKKKLLEAAAGSAGGAGLNVEEVFSTYLYTGNSSTQTITNGIDLAGEGGLVWSKWRSGGTLSFANNRFYDTVRGATKYLDSNLTNEERTETQGLTAFNSDGYNLDLNSQTNAVNGNYASWTFRKAPKFFDVVTYTGNGNNNRTVSHNLGSTPGFIIIKSLDTATNFIAWHRTQSNIGFLNLTNSWTSPDYWYFGDGTSGGYTAPTDSTVTLANANTINGSSTDYVMYLFAHNDGDGDFGPTGDQDIIKCGSYVGDATDYQKIDLGFEAQWVITKRVSGTSNWDISDNMRGLTVDDNRKLEANSSLAETTETFKKVYNNGFMVSGNNSDSNAVTHTYIYIAIRRGPMAVPESANDVFAVDTLGGTSPTPPAFYLGAPVDLQVWRSDVTAANNWEARDRLRGLYGRLKLNLTDAEDSNGGNEFSFDQMLGQGSATGTNTNRYSWMWKRAPSFMDVVAYTGDGVAGRTVSHNLGVAPEMMWVKNRGSATDWIVYHSGVSNSYGTITSAAFSSLNVGYYFGNNDQTLVSPTDSVFTIGGTGAVNWSGKGFIAYLFASLDGVSKVGSYTGNGSSNGDSQNIDCGFSSGARFVLIKRTDNTGNWLLFDTKRGIISGNDPALRVNSTGSNFNGYDFLEPNSNGFNVLYQDVSSSYNPNISGASYIFYAIA